MVFTPIETTLGALLLQQATTTLLFNNGSVLGASGMLRGLLTAPSRKNATFIAGMGLSFALLTVVLPERLPHYAPAEQNWYYALWTLGMGALTGWGTKNGCGCTSGHMLCGLSRLSARSLIAVATFFPVAMVTHHLLHPGLLTAACPPDMPCYVPVYPASRTVATLAAISATAIVALRALPPMMSHITSGVSTARTATQLLSGTAFGLGLLVSGMASPDKVLAFFSIRFLPKLDFSQWDPSLALIIVFAIVPNVVSWNFLAEHPPMRDGAGKPKYAETFEVPTTKLSSVNLRFVVGAAAFGVAWGASGVCPGPAILRAFAQPAWGALWMGGFWLGSKIGLL